ncbi:hypothetical protein [Gallaecimonas sp. GXIMD4217]|uniref:hypothetical protein n=1 Tax=Gallaecimonas sp. GXIMD4217 TaxID=3131927 RepID=UPI00311B19B0
MKAWILPLLLLSGCAQRPTGHLNTPWPAVDLLVEAGLDSYYGQKEQQAEERFMESNCGPPSEQDSPLSRCKQLRRVSYPESGY